MVSSILTEDSAVCEEKKPYEEQNAMDMFFLKVQSLVFESPGVNCGTTGVHSPLQVLLETLVTVPSNLQILIKL